MEWISVKERLPENLDHVLVSVISKNRKQTVFGGVRYNVGEKRWIFPLGGITHWMPFPEPPIAQENRPGS